MTYPGSSGSLYLITFPSTLLASLILNSTTFYYEVAEPKACTNTIWYGTLEVKATILTVSICFACLHVEDSKNA